MNISDLSKLSEEEMAAFRIQQDLKDGERDCGWGERILLEVIQGIHVNPSDTPEQEAHRKALIPGVTEAMAKGYIIGINGG